jgi:hypothetical protein
LGGGKSSVVYIVIQILLGHRSLRWIACRKGFFLSVRVLSRLFRGLFLCDLKNAYTAEEFIRRFLLHVLPSGFVRIRHFGFLANCHRETKLSLCRELLGVPQIDRQQSSKPDDCKTLYETLTGRSFILCPACRQGQMIMVEILPPQKQLQGIGSC